MGHDLALGVIILVAAIRGWLQGFVYQTVRIAGLIACVYLAVPVRDYAKPYVLPYLPTIQPELIDRLLWWVSAAGTYVVLVGCTMLVIKLTRRPEIPGISQSGRNDQFAGFLLGVAKGLVIASFLTAAVQKYAMSQIKAISWADEQVRSSLALKWNEEYQPGARMWSSPPVRHFVNHVQRQGLQNPSDPARSPIDDQGDRPMVKTANRTPGSVRQVDRPSGNRAPSETLPAPASRPLDEEVEKAVEDIKSHLEIPAAKPSN